MELFKTDALQASSLATVLLWKIGLESLKAGNVVELDFCFMRRFGVLIPYLWIVLALFLADPIVDFRGAMANLNLHIVPEVDFSVMGDCCRGIIHPVLDFILVDLLSSFMRLKLIVIEIALHTAVEAIVENQILDRRMLRRAEIVRCLVERLIVTLRQEVFHLRHFILVSCARWRVQLFLAQLFQHLLEIVLVLIAHLVSHPLPLFHHTFDQIWD